jgi:hypothetical protein
MIQGVFGEVKGLRKVKLLIQDGTFSKKKKKALLNDAANYEIVLLDTAETPIERPKKDSVNGTVARRNVTP